MVIRDIMVILFIVFGTPVLIVVMETVVAWLIHYINDRKNNKKRI